LRPLDGLKITDARLRKHKLHQYYLYQIIYFPVKENHSDYSSFLTPSIKIANSFFAVILCEVVSKNSVISPQMIYIGVED